ncbi:MAG: hypothetical protein NTU43_03100 [Bacteroidetes bacterium]|nr:hypothetical protein [Bacteroidota bacterium]
MKLNTLNRLTFLLCLLILSINSKAQDIIYKNDGSETKAKILEISKTEIKYKRFNYLDGPTFTISVSEINFVKYPNGETERFNKKNNENNNTPVIPIIKAENKPEMYDGIEKTNYPTGELLSETPYIKGKVNGIQKLYYRSGSIISETPFHDGLANGVGKTYWKSGKQMFDIPYIQGNITGSLNL